MQFLFHFLRRILGLNWFKWRDQTVKSWVNSYCTYSCKDLFYFIYNLGYTNKRKKKKKNLVQQKPVSMSFKLQCHTTQIFGASLFAKVLASFRTSVYSFKNNSRSEKWNGCCVSPLSHQAARPCSVFLFFRKDSWVITNKVSCSYNEK